jgi:cytochrome c553
VVDFAGLLLLAVVPAATALPAVRIWRRGRPRLRRIRAGLVGLLCLLSTAFLILALTGYRKLTRRYPNPVPDIRVAVTPDLIGRGEPLIGMCAGCHSEDGEPPLEGLDPLSRLGAPPILCLLGRIYAPNLTPIHLEEWSDGEIIRAIRQGIHRTGRSLVIMPSALYTGLSDDDVAAIVAYLRAQPVVEPDTPPTRFRVLGAVAANFGPIFSVVRSDSRPTEADSRDSSPARTLLASSTCTACHGPDLSGVAALGSADLTTVATSWDEEDFLSFFRTGVRPNGEAVDAALMPWPSLAGLFSEEDLREIFLAIVELRGATGRQ